MRKSNTRRIILSVLLLLLSSVSQAVACAKVFVYDSAGRTTSVTTSAGTTTLSWDYEDRLTGITYLNTSTNSFGYNAFGARVSKSDSSGTSTYARNGTSVIAPVLSDGSLTFTPGISSNDGSDSTFSHADIKNSLRQTSANETTNSTLTYDAFGNPVSSSGSWSGPFQYGGPFGYQTDQDSSLKLLGHRYCDSSTGRFLSRDPIGNGRNWFTYSGNNPIGYADPTGLFEVIITIGPDGRGVATVIADPGDIWIEWIVVGGVPVPTVRKGKGGEVIGTFPVSNIVPNPGADPTVVGGKGPFPPGTYEITGVESGRGMGPKFIVFRGQGPAGKRYTWVHSGAGDNWEKSTEGCIRGRESDITWLSELYELNRGNGNRHRVTVGPRGSQRFGQAAGSALGKAMGRRPVRLPVLHPSGGLQ